MLINLCASNISIRFGFLVRLILKLSPCYQWCCKLIALLCQGPNHTVSTAGSTGTHSIGNAFRMIRSGDADAMLAGAADSYLTSLEVAAFARF